MTKRFLTIEEQDFLDPTGEARRKLAGYKVGPPTPTPGPLAHLSREQWLQHARSIRNSLKGKRWSPYIEWDETFEKKYGGQGDTFPLSELEQSYETSYSRATRSVRFKLARIGRDFLLSKLRSIVQQYGYPSPIPAYHGTIGTLASLPTMAKKGTFLAETVGMSPWRHVIPELPGQRSQRLNHRCINMGPNPNVRYIEEPLARVRNYLRDHIPWFASWLRPDISEQPQIAAALAKSNWSLGSFDYSHCDESFGLEIATEIVAPIYELLLDKMEYVRVFSFVEELFYQPIFMGNYMLEGKHNLLSGEVITNDFETIYDVCVAVGVLLINGVQPESALILANGDDVLISTSQSVMHNVIHDYISEATLNGMEMKTEKCSLTSGYCMYLKRYYIPGYDGYNADGRPYRRGAYPLTLTYNSIVNPERHAHSYSELVAATMQRTDNLYGSPVFSPVVGDIFARWRQQLPSKADIEASAPSDWWSRLYGTSWTVETSPTYHTLKALRLV